MIETVLAKIVSRINTLVENRSAIAVSMEDFEEHFFDPSVYGDVMEALSFELSEVNISMDIVLRDPAEEEDEEDDEEGDDPDGYGEGSSDLRRFVMFTRLQTVPVVNFDATGIATITNLNLSDM